MPKRVTMATVAAHVGVSVATVSNAYNNPTQLSPATRRRILTAAAKLGYRGPNATARSLRTQKTGNIGVLFTDDLTYAFEDKASVDFLAGMSEASYGTNYSLTLVPAFGETLAPAELVGRVAVDGFAVYSVGYHDPYLDEVLRHHLPVVVCDQPYCPENVPFVGIDDFDAIAPAAQALVDAGHTKPGIVCIRLDRERNDGPVSAARLDNASHHVQRSRVQGALAVFRAAGITNVPVIERYINNKNTAMSAAEELLERFPGRDAICCTTDSLALGAYTFTDGKIAVTGFDGIDEVVRLGITTVDQHNKRKGAEVGRMLNALIAGAPPRHTILPTTFIPGRTAAIRRVP